MNSTTIQEINEFINKLQYYIGEVGHTVVIKNKDYDTTEFDLLSELVYVLDYYDKISLTDKTDNEVIAEIDFFETRYNLNSLPYIVYPKRNTDILTGQGVNNGSLPSTSFGIEEAPSNNKLYGRKNRVWEEIIFTQSQVNNWNQSYQWGDHSLVGYITNETDPVFIASPAFNITNQKILNWDQAYSWGNHATQNYALTSNLHDALTLNISNGLSLNNQVLSLALATSSTPGSMSASDKVKLNNLETNVPVTIGSANGLSLTDQELSLGLATITTPGAMSASDKIKLNNLETNIPVTLGTTNGLSLSGQELSLGLATTLVNGAMSSSDKTKLNSLSNYIHPTGFTSAPASPLNGANIISRIIVNNEGHVTGVDIRALSITNLGVTQSELSVVDDTNVQITLSGTPQTALFNDVTLTLGWTGELSVTRGGTGVSSFTSGELLVGNGGNAISTISRSGIDTRTSFPASSHTLTSHSDVSITAPSQGQLLVYKAGIWVNSTLAAENISLTEEDPIFTAFRDTSRAASTFYSAPTSSSGVPSFRQLVTNDIPNVYVRFDTNSQGLSSTQKQNVLTNIGAQSEFTLSNVTTTTSVIDITNGSNRVIGSGNLQINHADSGWVDKTTLTGAFVISNLEVDSHGHLINWTARELSVSDFGVFLTDKNYVHQQNTPLSTWTIQHNLNKKPSVTIIDSAGSMILAKLVYVDLNNISIDFDGSLTSGEAIFN